VTNIPQSGDVYEVIRAFSTLAGVSYDLGDHMELIEPTGQSPYGHQSKICNWVVKCKYWTPPQPQTVWSMIWYLIDQGFIRKIEKTGYRG
jgi:hypothetical protein